MTYINLRTVRSSDQSLVSLCGILVDAETQETQNTIKRKLELMYEVEIKR